MNIFKLKFQFHESTTKVESQLDHMWANVVKNACKLSVMRAQLPYFHKKKIYCIQIIKHTTNL